MSNRTAKSTITCEITFTIFNEMDDGEVTAQSSGHGVLASDILNNGCAENQADRAWSSAHRELTSGNSETIDLYQFAGLDIGGGAGNDAVGQAITLEELVTLIIVVESGDGSLELTPGASNPFNGIGSHTVATGGAINAGGVRFFHEPGEDGFDLSSTSRNIKIAAVGGDIVYGIYVLGRHDSDESSTSSPTSSSSSSTSTSSSETSSSTRSSASSLSSSSSTSSQSGSSSSSSTSSKSSSSSSESSGSSSSSRSGSSSSSSSYSSSSSSSSSSTSSASSASSSSSSSSSTSSASSASSLSSSSSSTSSSASSSSSSSSSSISSVSSSSTSSLSSVSSSSSSSASTSSTSSASDLSSSSSSSPSSLSSSSSSSLSSLSSSSSSSPSSLSSLSSSSSSSSLSSLSSPSSSSSSSSSSTSSASSASSSSSSSPSSASSSSSSAVLNDTAAAGSAASSGSPAWTNTGNIFAADSSNADCSLNNGETSGKLIGTGFGFAIPGGATIVGIKLSVTCSYTTDSGGTYCRDSTIQLTKNGSTSSSSNLSQATALGGTMVYGGATELWGLTWTPAEINASTFGAMLDYFATGDPLGSATAHVDYVEITVYYSP